MRKKGFGPERFIRNDYSQNVHDFRICIESVYLVNGDSNKLKMMTKQ